MKPSGEFLFVYGSLRKPAAHPCHQTLERHAEYIGEALFRGKLYLVATYPGAVPSESPDDRVRGELYRLSDPEKVFNKLDVYEGYDPGNRRGSLFVRSRQEVELAENEECIETWIYLYNKPTASLKQIASGDYLKHVKADRA